MGKQSEIEWTDHTWNPWYGCHRVSPGCKHCYMYREMERYDMDAYTVIKSKTKFREPLKWTEPAKVFTCSWSDFFIEDTDLWRKKAWEIIQQTPHLIYQILTKRPENIIDRLPEDWGDGYENVWLGVTAENQEMANIRIPQLLEAPAHIRFVSAEPLLESIEFQRMRFWLDPPGEHIHWMIVGGESGPNRRPLDLNWARKIRDQCLVAGVPFFMKQIDKVQPIPEDLMVREFPDV